MGSLARMSKDAQSIAWVCLTSSNLSKAAWGTLQKNNSQLFCRHWELGLLFTPATLARKSNGFSCDLAAVTDDLGEPSDHPEGLCQLAVPQGPGAVQASSRKTAMMPLPYQLPPAPYPSGGRPWSVGMQMWSTEPWFGDTDRPNRPDRFGRTNCSSCMAMTTLLNIDCTSEA